MTLLYQREGKDADDVPGTHALLIGCGNYPHLLGGKAKLIRRPEGMVASLESPALSVKALTEWLLGTRADGRRFQNPAAPLASVEVLTDNGTFAGSEVEAPTRIAIENAFAQWMDRAKGHPQSVAFFYFCGHGLTGHADDKIENMLIQGVLDPEYALKLMSNTNNMPGNGLLDSARRWTGSGGGESYADMLRRYGVATTVGAGRTPAQAEQKRK